jgi:hypothetical protein
MNDRFAIIFFDGLDYTTIVDEDDVPVSFETKEDAEDAVSDLREIDNSVEYKIVKVHDIV